MGGVEVDEISNRSTATPPPTFSAIFKQTTFLLISTRKAKHLALVLREAFCEQCKFRVAEQYTVE